VLERACLEGASDAVIDGSLRGVLRQLGPVIEALRAIEAPQAS